MSVVELPCRKCGHVWEWVANKSPAAAVCPKGYGCSKDRTMSVDTVRELCYEELEMCCQTLCNKQDVWNYIKQLEDEIERLKGQDDG